jgi:L-seryl-tRNA(Ser) seleniumtransferase
VADALAAAAGYCNLQMDLETGDRSHREEAIRELVTELTGAQDCVLVNNNAGATLLVLRALAKGREVVISRGELIEIGGEFRLPDVMAESGAILREVGATNKTHLRDYAKAVGPDTGLIMKAHKSNYAIVGFTHDVGIGEIAAVGHRRKIPVVDDLGCGALVPLERFGMEHEMTVRESLDAGADVVLFSTDKLIGGPQGGLIVGRKDLIGRIRSCPLYRTLRVCKLTLAALETTLRLFRSVDTLGKTHPVYRMISRPGAELEAQARKLEGDIAMLQPAWAVRVSAETSFLGGGALPTVELPSWAVALVAPGIPADALARALRLASVPVLARVKSKTVFLDMRTVFDGDLSDILEACRGIECAVS